MRKHRSFGIPQGSLIFFLLGVLYAKPLFRILAGPYSRTSSLNVRRTSEPTKTYFDFE